MAEPKESGKGGNGLVLSTPLRVEILERMLADLQERARPIQEEIRVVQQALQDLADQKFLDDRRRQLAAARQVQLPSGSTGTAS